jgi:hypothetical protein
MSAAVWNEPQDPEHRCRDVRRSAGAPRDADWNANVLMICAPRRAPESEARYAAQPRPAETTA